MNIVSIIGILFLIIAVIVVVKFIKHLLLAAILVLTLSTMCLVGIGLLVYVDSQNFSKSMERDPILFLLALGNDSSEIIAAAQLQPMLEGDSRNYSALDEQQIAYLERQYSLDALDDMRGTNARLIIVTLPALEQLPSDTFVVAGKPFTKQQIVRLVRAVNAQNDMASMLAGPQASPLLVRQQLELNGLTSNKIKADILMLTVQDLLSQERYPYFISSLKKDTVIISPETPLVTILHVLPENLFMKIVKKAVPQNKTASTKS